MPEVQIIDTNADSIRNHGFCGFNNQANPGHCAKSDWLAARFPEGLRFKLLMVDGADAGMIEYAPSERAWRPIEADNYFVIHCLMLSKKKYKGEGYGSLLADECERDARQAGRNGVAVVTSAGTWMVGPELFFGRGYELADSAPPSYKLLARRFSDAPLPRFAGGWEQTLRTYGSGLTILTSDQCPCIPKCVADISAACAEMGIEPKIVQLASSAEARRAPSAYGIFNVIHDGEIVAEHPISGTRFRSIMRRRLGA